MPRILGALLLAVALLALTACGGGDAEASQDREIERLACEQQARNAAEARVLAELYERGELGTRAQIERELKGWGVSIFAPGDGMIPYRQMTQRQQAALNNWKQTNRVFRIGQTQRREAKRAIRPDC